MQHLESERFIQSDPQSAKRGIEKIAAILSPETHSKNSGHSSILMVDLDYTTIEGVKLLWTDGRMHRVYPETVAAFMAAREAGVCIGVVTEQAFTQLEPQLNDVALLAFGEEATAYDLFNGPVIGEGGGVVRRGKGEKQGELVILTPSQARRDLVKMVDWLKKNITYGNPNDNWGVLPGVDPTIGTLVKLPDDMYQGVATISLWEKGPHVMEDSSYIDRYAQVKARMEQVIREVGITSLKAYEGGNGTIRITYKGIDKARTITRLANFGFFDLKHMVFACNGPNDVELARTFRARGGAVITVGNAIPELHKIADYSAQKHAGLGFAEAIAQIFPEEYGRALANLCARGLGLAEQAKV